MWPPHLLLQIAAKRGMPSSELDSLKATLAALAKSGVAPILSLRHLCLLTGASYHFLRHVIGRSGTFAAYRHHFVAKRSGGRRILFEPHAMLSHVQRWIVDNVLNKIQTHAASHAFAPDSKITKCAKVHCGAKWLVKLDIRNFFESISEVRVFETFLSIGYPNLVAFELSRICTFPFEKDHPRYKEERWRQPQTFLTKKAIAAYSDHRIGHLPQGAPTSPMLANLVCRNLDVELEKICNDLDWQYTRYADDISCSALKSDRASVQELLHRIMGAISRYGFKANKAKTTIASPGARKVVLGLLVDGAEPQLSRVYRRSLEAHLYFALKFGLVEHARRRGFISPLSLLDHLQGKITYAQQIGDRDAAKWKRQFQEIRLNFLGSIVDGT